MKHLSVVPGPEDLNRLKNLQLIARWAVEGFISGLHKSPYYGYSSEFLEYSQYTPGDDLRYLDWKVYGRSDRTYIKRFQSETNLRAYVLLDTSRSMSYVHEKRDKFTYAKSLAACLVYLFQRQGDAAGLATFSDKIHSFRVPKSSPRHRRELFTILEDTKASGESRFGSVLDELSERISGRSIIILLSDFYGDVDGIIAGLRHLRFKRHEVLAFHIMDPSEEDFDFDGMLHMIDLENGKRLHVDAALVREEYCKRFKAHVDKLHMLCSDSLVDHRVVRTDIPFAEALAAYLNHRLQAKK